MKLSFDLFSYVQVGEAPAIKEIGLLMINAITYAL